MEGHFMDHVRDHRSVLATTEKRLLVRIANHLPPFINSDHLSGLALASMLAAGLAFALIGYTRWAAAAFVALLAINWFGDSLDGTLARVRNQQRPKYGYYVDHVIDLAGTAALLFGMAASGLMTPSIAFALLAVYLLVAAESFLGTHAIGVFRMSFAGFGPTELRILLAAGAIKVASNPVVTIAGIDALLLDIGGIVAIIGLGVAFVTSAIRNSLLLYRVDPLPVSTAPRNQETTRNHEATKTRSHEETRNTQATRGARFVIVGLLGFVVQIGVLALLTALGLPWLPATVVAVECAILQNYFWHRRWTWDDRRGSLLRFNASTALTSIGGNVLLMAVLVGGMKLPVVFASAVAVGVISLANFVIGDRWAFAAVICLMAVPAEAAPSVETLSAWNQFVAATESRIANQPTYSLSRLPEGSTIDVGDGTISDWRGSVLIPHVTLDAFLHRLQNPGTPPPQEDVAASRVLSRSPEGLHLYIRLVRHAIVTVTYDTEHDMSFRRLSPAAAVARSVATRIDEVGGGDKGFLWRLNSYWYYQQTTDGVAVSLESLTLSRDVPLLIKPLAGQIVPRIARESMVRTLDALRAYFS
jgi:putative flippase GtrA/phosphatidylglycerophosphate synthase